MTLTTEPFDPAFLRGAVPGTVVGEPRGRRVVTDSRGEVAGALFVALRGPRFDGHDFVERVLARGAGGAMVSASWWAKTGRGRVNDLFVVPDTLLGLQELARAHRLRHPVPLVAVTGSNGKTTTKELLAAALAPRGPVHRTQGNLNNHIGLPLTLLELSAHHRAAVVEIGLNRPGELRWLSSIARPRVAVVTNVAEAHLEGLNTLQGVARAKAEIVEGLEPDGVLVHPARSPALVSALEGYRGGRVTFGTSEGADLAAREVRSHGWRGVTVVLEDGTEVETRLPGRHVAENLLAALAAARVLGVPPAEAAPHLRKVDPIAGRLCPRQAAGVVVLDDTYNANPASLAASLEVLMQGAATGRRWAVLGDMLELGEGSAELHRRAGAAAAGLDGLVTVGELAVEIAEGAVEAGLDPARAERAGNPAEAARLLAPRLRPGDVVLIKASRGMRLEGAVDAILAARKGSH